MKRTTRVLCAASLAFIALIPVPTLADQNGYLATSSGPVVYDADMAKMIDKYFEDGDKADGQVNSNIFIVHTACYGGDWLENFNDTTGDVYPEAGFDGPTGDPLTDNTKFTNTTFLSAQEPGKTSTYGGYHDDAANTIAPGLTANTVHMAGYNGKAANESPFSSGNLDRAVGGASSTHVLIWAGKPDNRDNADILNVVDHFSNQPNTTIHVLSGDGSATNAAAATKANLENAFQQIGGLMDDGPDEQFIMFITDHGGEANFMRDGQAAADAFNNSTVAHIDLASSVYQDMLNDDNNQAVAQFVVCDPFPQNLLPSIGVDLFGVHFLGYLSDADSTEQVTLPGGAPGTAYNFLFDESLLSSLAQNASADLATSPISDTIPIDFGVTNFTSYAGQPTTIYFDRIGLLTGDIAKSEPTPEPASLTLLALATLACRRRRFGRSR